MPRLLPSHTEMLRAFLGKDVSYDGVFLAGVTTTRIFCRPSCTARKPKRDHVRFFQRSADALAAGFRPCRRCDPLRAHGAQPEWVSTLIARAAASDRRIGDADLAASGLDPVRVRRYFRKHFGMTFHSYTRRHRMGVALSQIRDGQTLDEVIMSKGFESHSGFRDAFARTFGRAPGQSRGTTSIVCTWIDSPLGPLLVAATPDGVCLLEFTDPASLPAQVDSLQRQFSAVVVPGKSALFDELRTELEEYFAGRLRRFSVPLVTSGTPFEERVWAELQRIPFGETRSYEDVARVMGAFGAQRAVGRANGRNRLAILIPCHRVVNKSGKLGGYGGSVWRKASLLDLERTGQMTAPLLFHDDPSEASARVVHKSGRPSTTRRAMLLSD